MINQELINKITLNNAGSLLKNPYKAKWNQNNPTYGYCYIVSEAVYHFAGYGDNFKPYCINLGQGIGVHWWLSDGIEIIDFTSSQFPFDVDYSKGVRKPFFKGSIQTDKGFISKRGYEIAKLLKLTEQI